MRLAFAIAFGCTGAAACCLQTVGSGLVGIASDGGVETALVWPPGTAAIATGDLNRDGIQDLAFLASFYDAGAVYLYYGLPDGGLSQGPVVDLPAFSWNEWGELGVFDLNGDGWPDLIASSEYYIGIAMNQSDGGFIVYSRSEFNSPITFVMAGRFDRSGRADLIVGGFQGLALLLDEGDVPSFSAPSTFLVPPLTALEGDDVVDGLGVGDLDGDGQMDIVSYEVNDRGDEYFVVRRGIGDGGFRTPAVYPSSPDPQSHAGGIVGPIVVADVNGDGLPDVVAATYKGFALRLGLGGGRLGDEIDVPGDPPAQFGTNSIAVVDTWDAGLEVITGGSWTCDYPEQLPVSRPPMAFRNDGGGNFLTGVPFSAGETHPGPFATWPPAGANRPVLVVGDFCAPNVSFVSE